MTEKEQLAISLAKEIKRNVQRMRTEINLYKKCLSTIVYRMDNTKKGIYDYGEASESTIDDIKEIIQDCNNKVSSL